MASLIKRPGSKYYIAAFDVTMPDGSVRRLKKTTKKTKRAEAIVEALRIEETEKKKHASTDESASKAFAILSDAAEAAARGELSEGRARELLARLTEASMGAPLRFYTVRTWAADWLAAKEATKAATLVRYKAHIGVFLEWLGNKADGRLESVTKAEIREFRNAIHKGWSPQGKRGLPRKSPIPRTGKTTNHYASDVAGMFRAAVREGLLLASPAAALQKLPEDDSSERETFTVAEIGLMIEAAGNPLWQDPVFIKGRDDEAGRDARCVDWQGLILAGFYLGPRLCDCARLSVANLDDKNEAVTFMPAKTSRKRKKLTVPIHPRMRSWIECRDFGTGPETPLFPALVNCPIGGRHGLSSQFIAIMEFAGIDRRTVRQGTKGGQRAQHARSFHALRHSLTSALANADVPEEIRRRIVGHESAEVHAGYTHTERATIARALDKLPSI